MYKDQAEVTVLHVMYFQHVAKCPPSFSLLSSSQLLAVLLRAVLREGNGEATSSVATSAAAALHELLCDGTPVVLKAVCESLRICLPALATSSNPQLGQLL